MPRPKARTPTYSLTKRGGIWYVIWWQDGAAKRTSCRTSDLGEARVFREALISELGTPPPPPSPTIGAIVEAYADDRAPHVHSEAITYAKKALLRHLEHVPASSLTARRVQGYVEARRKEGAQGASVRHRKQARPLSDGTLRRELGVLRAALAWAVKAGWIKIAPAIEMPPKPPARERWVTKTEAERLLACAETLHVRTFLALALFTAGRAEAIVDLTWDRVDERAGLITLASGQASRQKRRAVVPIADDLRPYLAEARNAALSPFVVEWRGDRVGSVKKAVRTVAEAAGLPWVTAHVLRHTAATWMVQAGLPFSLIARYLGDTEAMIEQHYGHHSPDFLRPGAAALNLGQLPRKPPKRDADTFDS